MKCLFVKSELEDKVNSIDSLMNCEVRGIMNTLDLDINDFNSIVEKYTIKEKDFIMNSIINGNLNEINDITKLEYHEIENSVNTIMNFYANFKSKFDNVIKVTGDKLANQILFKEINYNESNNDKRVDVAFIKNQYLSSIEDEDIKLNILIWIALKYIAIIRVINFCQNNNC